MATIEDATSKALDSLVGLLEEEKNYDNQGLRLEAAREILKYSAAMREF